MKELLGQFDKEIKRCQMKKEKEKLSALRLLKSEFLAEVKDKHADENDKTFVTIAGRLHKQMEKALLLTEDTRNRMLLNVCQVYIPKVTTKEDIDKFLDKQAKTILMKALKDKFGESLNGRIAIQSVMSVLK